MSKKTFFIQVNKSINAWPSHLQHTAPLYVHFTAAVIKNLSAQVVVQLLSCLCCYISSICCLIMTIIDQKWEKCSFLKYLEKHPGIKSALQLNVFVDLLAYNGICFQLNAYIIPCWKVWRDSAGKLGWQWKCVRQKGSSSYWRFTALLRNIEPLNR